MNTRVTVEETSSSRQMLINATWAIGSIVGFVGTIQLIGWLMGAL